MRFLVEDIQELKPTIFCGVPRVYDRIYTGFKLTMMFFPAVSLSTSYRILFHSFMTISHIDCELSSEGINDKILSGGALKRRLFQFAYN